MRKEGGPMSGDRVAARRFNYDGRQNTETGDVLTPDADEPSYVEGILQVATVDTPFGERTQYLIMTANEGYREVEPDTIRLLSDLTGKEES